MSSLGAVPLPQALQGFGSVLASGHSSLALPHHCPFSHSLVALSRRGPSGGSAFPPGPPAPAVVAAPPCRGSVFSQPHALPSVRLFSLVLVTLSDCSGRSSQVSLFSAITTLFFKQIPLRLSLSDRLKVVPFDFLV